MKKTLCITLILALLIPFGITAIHADFSCINYLEYKYAGRYGDADRNGKIDVKDATTIQKSIAGLEFMNKPLQENYSPF